MTRLLVIASGAAVAALAVCPHLGHAAGNGGGSPGGVVLIDQARAEAGIGGGDAPGFPITIAQRGHYRLTGDLVVTDPHVRAIDVNADHVTLELNGFGIYGPVACGGVSAGAITCTPNASSSYGVLAGASFMTVRNGTIRGFGSGVMGGSFNRIEALQVAHIRWTGIHAGNASQVSDNIVAFVAGDAAIRGHGDIRHNTVFMARQNGINAGSGALVTGNRVSHAGGYGINADGSGDATLAGNSVKNAALGAVHAGLQIDGNACNGQLCP